ncbi:MAG: hypothetical protein KAJ51_00220, partial [Thermoplasmata archaeon]|nr:hypothetical protein [Thermoplasmata archaeon]
KEKHSNLAKKGVILTTPQNLINDAEKAIKSNNYADATKLAKQSLQNLKEIELDYNKIEKLISAANSKMAEAKTAKLKTSKAEKINDQITTFKEKGEYNQALQLTRKLIKTVETLIQTYNEGTALIEKAFTLINEAKSLEADTFEAETLYDEAASEMEQGSYGKAIQLANNSIESAEQAKGESTTKLQKKSEGVLSELDGKLKNAKEIGANINEPIIMVFNQVKSAFEKNDFKFAFDNAELCKNSIEEARNQHQNALAKIQAIRVVINEAKEAGANTKNAERMILEADKALENFDYAAIDAQINMAQDEAGHARERHHQVLGQQEQAEEVIKTAKITIMEIKNAGMIATQSEELLTKAETAFSSSDFQAAQTQANTAIKECQDLHKLYLDLKESLQKAETSIAKSKLFIDTTEVEKLFEQSQTSMNSGNYSEALEFTTRIITSIETVKTNSKPIIKLKSSEVPTFKSGSWGKMQLELVNEGKIHANDIKFNISEELESRGFFNITVLKAGTSRTIDMGLRTNEIGDLPVNIDISYLNPVNQEQLSTQQILWVKTEPGEPGLKPEAIEAPQDAPGPPAEPEGEVKVLSEVEFFQGFIRLKVGVKNDQNTVITDTKLDIEYDDTAMRFDKIEPELTRKGNKIIFGNIHPKEKKTVACYLDPLICMESHIDGSLTYKDIWGNLKTAVMKRRKAEIVCPIFYTPENINTAMLKRLINEELAIHDNKIYEIPYGVDFKRANDICKETIQGHDLKFVRQFVERDIDDPEIESWFYGITKVKKNQVVIKASSRKKTNTIELFVACKSKQTLTGFLAELAHNLNDKLKELGIITQPILPVTDVMTRDMISQTASLLSNQILDKATLSLSKRGDEYEVGFKASDEGGEASEVFEFIKVSPDSRKDIISQIGDVVTISNIFYCTRGKLGNSNEEKILEEVKKELNKKDSSDRVKEIADSQLQNIKALG